MARYQLFCIPHAGASAAVYYRLRAPLAELAEVLPVELAGHGARMREPLPISVAEHVDDLYPRIRKQFDGRPAVLFSHSMGTLIGYELLRRLEADVGLIAEHAIFSGRHTPEIPATSDWHTFPDRAFLGMIRRIGGTDPAVLDNSELTRVFLPILRADYQVAETFQLLDPGRVLNCPVTAFAGSIDGFVSEAQLLRWSEFTTASFSSQIFPGGHFYLFDDINRTCRAISQVLLDSGAAHPVDLFTR